MEALAIFGRVRCKTGKLFSKYGNAVLMSRRVSTYVSLEFNRMLVWRKQTYGFLYSIDLCKQCLTS